MTRFHAWREIQRQRLAHWILAQRLPADWTPRTIAQAQADDALWQRLDALNAREPTLDDPGIAALDAALSRRTAGRPPLKR